MLIEISVSNFKSIKDELTLSMVIGDIDSNELEDNTIRLSYDLHLLKTAIICGPNGSGKSNIINAFYECCNLIECSGRLKENELIASYQPFEFDTISKTQPTSFKIAFLNTDNIKYYYEITFNSQQILTECLSFYSKDNQVNIFSRVNGSTKVDFGDGVLDSANMRRRVSKNMLFLSISNDYSSVVNSQLYSVYSYFKNINFWNSLLRLDINDSVRKISEMLYNDYSLLEKIRKLFKCCDFQINDILLKFNNESRLTSFDKNKGSKYYVKMCHSVYDNDNFVMTTQIDINNESHGVKILFVIGAIVIKILETGGIICVDHYFNELHSELCNFLIEIFHTPSSNPNNAQLIFTTHNTTLLSNTNNTLSNTFRKDQIWFTEKNKKGETKLFSVYDFTDVPIGIDVQDWYLVGRFGAKPIIKEIEFIYGK